MLPPHVAEAIQEHLDNAAPKGSFYALAGEECEGADFHSPRPLVLCRVSLSPRKKTAQDPTVVLCPTCASNLVVLQKLLVATGGELEWPVRREFGNKLRALALKGYETGA